MTNKMKIFEREISVAVLGAAGKMGSSIIRGLLKAGMSPDNIIGYDVFEQGLNELRKECKIRTVQSNEAAVRAAEIIILAVKPQQSKGVLEEIAPLFDKNKKDKGKDKVLISIMAGVPTKKILETMAEVKNTLFKEVRIIRAMPNIAVSIREAFTAICEGKFADSEDMEFADEIFKSCGTVEEVDEGLMDVMTGLNGSGSAFTFLVMESMAAGAVSKGCSSSLAKRIVAQNMLGAAKMFLETGKHPAELKDQVTSPGGTTAQGLRVLEKYAARSAFIEAVAAAAEKAEELGQKKQKKAKRKEKKIEEK